MDSTLSEVLNQLLDPAGGPFTLESLSRRIHIPVARIREHLAGHVPLWGERIVYLQFFHSLREEGASIPLVDIPERLTPRVVSEGNGVTVYIDDLDEAGLRAILDVGILIMTDLKSQIGKDSAKEVDAEK